MNLTINFMDTILKILILWHMSFKQTTVGSDSVDFANNCRVLKRAICEPHFNNTKILFWRNCDSIDVRQQLIIIGHGLSNQRIRKLFPRIRYVLVWNLV